MNFALDGYTYTPIDKNVNPYLPIEERLPDIFPLKLLGLCCLQSTFFLCHYLSLIFQSEDNECSLFFCQELGSLWKIMQAKECQYGHKYRCYSFQDEDPSPTCEAANAIHF